MTSEECAHGWGHLYIWRISLTRICISPPASPCFLSWRRILLWKSTLEISLLVSSNKPLSSPFSAGCVCSSALANGWTQCARPKGILSTPKTLPSGKPRLVEGDPPSGTRSPVWSTLPQVHSGQESNRKARQRTFFHGGKENKEEDKCSQARRYCYSLHKKEFGLGPCLRVSRSFAFSHARDLSMRELLVEP